MSRVVTEQQLRERFEKIAKDCPWKCLYESKKPCICREAAHQIIIDLTPLSADDLARTAKLAKQYGWKSE
jgi:hypothetical protein